jgi:signal transduction histidine kinase
MSEVVAKGRGLSPRRLLLQELRLVYANALEAHLVDATESSRRHACDIGQWAVAQGIGVVKTATIHHDCLCRILVRLSGALPFKEGLRRAAEFLAEVLSQYELDRRGTLEAAPALRALNEKMEREIQRIALAVHDEAGQLLYAARLAIAAAADAATPTVRERLAEVEAILNRAEHAVRCRQCHLEFCSSLT